MLNPPTDLLDVTLQVEMFAQFEDDVRQAKLRGVLLRVMASSRRTRKVRQTVKIRRCLGGKPTSGNYSHDWGPFHPDLENRFLGKICIVQQMNEVLSVQPVAKKSKQGISELGSIIFTKVDLERVQYPNNDPLVIQLRFTTKMSKESWWTLATQFIAIDIPSPYNAIVDRDWLHRMKGVASTLHQSLLRQPRKVELVEEEREVLEDVSKTPETKIVEDLMRYDLDVPSLNHFFLMSSNLKERERTKLIELVTANIEGIKTNLKQIVAINDLVSSRLPLLSNPDEGELRYVHLAIFEHASSVLLSEFSPQIVSLELSYLASAHMEEGSSARTSTTTKLAPKDSECQITDLEEENSSGLNSEPGTMPNFERTIPKIEISRLDLSSENLHSRHIGAHQKPQSESSDSLDGLFSDVKDEIAVDSHPQQVLHKPHSELSDSLNSVFGDDRETGCSPSIVGHICLKEEPDVLNEVSDERRASLLMMNFSVNEINLAMDKLGEDAAVNELVDFILGAQIAENQEQDRRDTNHGNEPRNQEVSTESLFGTMDKTLRLLEMGFSENQISSAIEKYGSEVPIEELADSICVDEVAGTSNDKNKRPWTSFSKNKSNTVINYRSWTEGIKDDLRNYTSDPFPVKTEEFSLGDVSHGRDIDLEKYKGKRPKEEYIDELSSFKRPKQEYDEDSSSFLGSTWLEARKGDSKSTSIRIPGPQREFGSKAGQMEGFGMPKLDKPKSCKSVDQMVAKPPYFFYANATNLSQECWRKLSQFLYAMEPEFVNTQFFSALSRKEGYIHNLPSGNRSHILPKPPMTIEEAIPQTKKWWPSWDSRKQLSCINSEISGLLQICDGLGKLLSDSRGLLSVEQQRDLPPSVQDIKPCLDTLVYHLSVLRSLFPRGLTVLSIFSGIGGAEISLHRLGIHLKGVVSVEPCETKRKVLKRWWENTIQTGELVQVESIMKLASNKLEGLIKKFGGFDLIICQNPYNHSSKIPAMDTDGDIDFSSFYEFVRVLQRVRNAKERSR
ncbi:S-adenosyl-L-methionine-dependent methyltransferases superfamily protein [Actinidia rufa]|uniref:S-adenosyl-L-methionine-dependent methyltransferases superfamily protein n=1 Tax=Actinidia rufa TaxID=165716 RepID=A0A7J0GLC5_9ERIC|nr:S-adenosyl-L-methionine-dependent methyltransferases superfamily protein [Actinidia rufa]